MTIHLNQSIAKKTIYLFFIHLNKTTLFNLLFSKDLLSCLLVMCVMSMARLKRAVQLFDQSDLSVKEIMHRTGFNTASYFSKCFKKQFGVIPSEYVGRMKNKKEILF